MRISPSPCFTHLRPPPREVLFTGWHHAHTQYRFCLRRLCRRVWPPVHAPFHPLRSVFFFSPFSVLIFWQGMFSAPAAARPLLKRLPLASHLHVRSVASLLPPTRSGSSVWTLRRAGGVLPVATPTSRAVATSPENSSQRGLNSSSASTRIPAPSRKPAV